MTLGEKIKQTREDKNLSQEELASRLEVSRQAVSKWENGTAIPKGINRDMLNQILNLNIASENEDTVALQKKNPVGAIGWIVSALLILVLIAVVAMKSSGEKTII